jgi:hypothetical protein
VGCNTIVTAIEDLSCGLRRLINLRSRYGGIYDESKIYRQERIVEQ